MITLETALRVPAHVSFSVVGEDAFLLNTQTNKYYGLEQVGARLWQIISADASLKDAHRTLLDEYDVAAEQLEQDLIELLEDMRKNGLIEIAAA